MTAGRPSRVLRNAAVDRIDRFVLRRARVLVDRARRGVGRQLAATVDALPGSVADAPDERTVVDRFHRLFYDSPSTWRVTMYRGVTTWKNPLDLWIYQEIIHEIRPDLIVETGTAYGGSGLFLADLCNALGVGEVVTVDVRERATGIEHPRLTKVVASSIDPEVYRQVAAMVPTGATVMVVLDSDHSRDHVLAELRLWSDLVTVGSYLIVEDTDINGHPVYADFGPGPWEAVQQFLDEHADFGVDESRHRFLLTSNPRGYLRRLR